MASTKQVLLLATVAATVACLASLASATQWMVGDDGGWRAKFDETGWADGKTFVVGDSLMFMYPKENHTVAQVGEDDFAACNLQGNLLGLWDSGNDVVQLDEPGKWWFICTKPNHCLNGMKLAIDVVVGGDDTSAPAPLPFPFPFPFPFPGAPAPQAAAASSSPRQSPFPFPFPGAPAAPAPEPSPSAPPTVQFPSPYLGSAPAQSPRSVLWWGSAPAPTPQTPPASPPSAAVRYPVGGAVAAAAAAVVAAALAF